MLVVAFAINVFIQMYFTTQALTPMIFVLGVFLVSWRTEGYFWGIVASLVNMFAVNYAFTFPYYEFNFILTENFFSAVVMLIVAVMTSALTTKIKQQEKLWAESEKEKMRANLLRAISHDLRTPLTSIYGSSSTLIEHYDSLQREQHLQLLQEISEDAQWLIRMVENLLSVTRINGDQVKVAKTPTVLEELVDTALLKFHKRYPARPVEVDIPDDFISIPMDALLIEQVIMNLLENAVLHAEGMTELMLRIRIEGDQAVFEVADNGCGIPKDRMKDLFSGSLPQSDAPADSRRSNMGIGLSVCAAIVHAHGGVITARNRPEGGALFRFVLEKGAEDEQ